MRFSENMNRVMGDMAEFGRGIAKQGKQALNTAKEKGKGLAEQGKLALDNQKQAQVILDAQQQIGAYVAENNLLADDAFVLEQISLIAAAQEQQERNKARIAELKASDKAEDAVYEEEAAGAEVCQDRFCPSCGTKVPGTSAFCHVCGTKLVD